MRRLPQSRATCGSSRSLGTPWFLRLNSSVAKTTIPISRQPAAAARSKPRAVQDQADVGDVVALRQGAIDGLGVRHLRHPPRIHEARDFDAPDSGIDGTTDELDLHVGRNQGGLVLQAVARPDLHDADAARVRHGEGLYTQRAAAISRRGPCQNPRCLSQPVRLDQRLATPRVLALAAAAAVNAFLASASFLLFASEMPSIMLTSSARFRLPLVTARRAASVAFG